MRCTCGSTTIHNHKRKLARYLLRHLLKADRLEGLHWRRLARKHGYHHDLSVLKRELRRDAA